MAFKAEIRTTFEPNKIIQPIYTGGSVALSQDGRILASCVGEDILLSDLSTGEHLARIEGDGDIVTTLSIAPDASFLAICSRTLSMRIFSLNPSTSNEGQIDARLVRSLKPHTAPVVTSAVDSTGTLLATGGADGSIKVWDIRRGFTTHTFHGHSGLVSALHFFQVDASSVPQRSKSRKRKSRHEDDVQMDLDVPDATSGYRLASGGEDGRIRIWDLHKRKSAATLESHVSVVRALDFCRYSGLLLSASRDKTVILWDSTSWQAKTTVPILESVESAGFVADGQYFYTGGETARLRIWDIAGQERTQEQESGEETEAVLEVFHYPDLSFLLSVHANQTLVMHSISPLQVKSLDASIPPLPVIRRISGSHDEIIDLAYIGLDSSLMALATNEPDIRLINVQRKKDTNNSLEAAYFGADIAQLKGHEDIVITIDTDWSGHWLATGAKDNTARLWRLDPASSDFSCHATFTGHAESISAVALPHAIPPIGSQAHQDPLSIPPSFLVTGSQDKTIKKWDILDPRSKSDVRSSRATYTRKAHDKDINAIEVSYASTSTMFASASQDRTVKIWDLESGESIGVLRGHKRGVWSVAFSPPSTPSISGESGTNSGNRGMAVTGSGDKTVRMWSLNDYSCLRTFEGHSNSVLKVIWLPPPSKSERKRDVRGVQVASAAGDGLVKVWDAQSGECATTLDNHIDRVWALAVKPTLRNSQQQSKFKSTDKTSELEDDDAEVDEDITTEAIELVSGSADSTLTFWVDTTALTQSQSASRATARVEQDQELQNHIHASNYREAIVLALQLNHPKRLLDLFTRVLDSTDKDTDSLTGSKGVDEVLASLSDDQLWKLMLRLRDWNANVKTLRVAQRVMYALFRIFPKERFVRLRKRGRRQGEVGDISEQVRDLDLGNGEDGGVAKAKSGESVRDVVDGLKAYTERHKARLDKMAEERHVLLWTLQCMDDTAGGVDGLVGTV